MEFIGRTVSNPDGTTRDEFVVRCEIHDWYYKGQPPLTHGCRECWLTYYTAQVAQSKGDIKTNVDQLESAIRHTAEMVDKGQWDFKPSFSMKIEHEN
jgi:hypothetical protein